MTGARSNTTGEQRDDELALEAHLAFLGHRRFSGEGSATIQPRSRAPAGEAHELDTLMAIFVGC
jgi:hypothetical protein